MSLFGEPIPKAVTSKHSGISPELREDIFKEYMDRKAREKPTNVAKATIVSSLAGVLAAHGVDETKEAVKRKLTQLVKDTEATEGIASMAQRKALKLIKYILPDAKNVPILKHYSKTKVTALLAGLGAIYGANRAITANMERERASGMKNDSSKLKRELAVRLSEMK